MTTNRSSRMKMIVGMALLILPAAASSASAQFMRDPGGITIILPAPTDFIDIVAGANHTCVRRYNGQVYCWGQNTSGQAGVTGLADTPKFVTSVSSQITAGGDHSCSLSGGVTSCWGINTGGELGDGTLTARFAPVVVNTSLRFTNIGAGNGTTCGVVGNTGDGTVACWGFMPLDPSKPSSSTTPKVIVTSSGLRTVAVGSRFFCVHYDAAGYSDTWCQGQANMGQLGQDPAQSWIPKTNGVAFTPFLVGTSFGATTNYHVVASDNYVCVDRKDGLAQCIGNNDLGKLGIGFPGDPGRPYEFSTLPISDTASQPMGLHGITAGLNHACALDAGGAAWCWGSGMRGENGMGTTSTGVAIIGNYSKPVSVRGGAFRAIAAGAQHTCGIGTDNRIYCWGDNTVGQLGVGLNNLGLELTRNGFGFTPITFSSTPRRLDLQ